MRPSIVSPLAKPSRSTCKYISGRTAARRESCCNSLHRAPPAYQRASPPSMTPLPPQSRTTRNHTHTHMSPPPQPATGRSICCTETQFLPPAKQSSSFVGPIRSSSLAIFILCRFNKPFPHSWMKRREKKKKRPANLFSPVPASLPISLSSGDPPPVQAHSETQSRQPPLLVSWLPSNWPHPAETTTITTTVQHPQIPGPWDLRHTLLLPSSPHFPAAGLSRQLRSPLFLPLRSQSCVTRFV